MNEILLTKETRNQRYLLGSPQSAPDIFRQIRGTLAESQLWTLFAEPVVLEGGARLAWRSPIPGKATCYQRLSNEDKGFAKSELRREVLRLQEMAKTFNDPALEELLANCIEVPDADSLYIVDGGAKKNVVIAQWGFVMDMPGAEKGLINKFIEARKVPMQFHVYFTKDGKRIPGVTAPDTEVVFYMQDKPFATVRSDAQGNIVLEGVKEEAKVSAYDPDDKALANPQNYVCYEFGIYDVFVSPKGNMEFRIVDQNDNPLPGMEFVLERDGNSVNMTSDAQGRIVLSPVKEGALVDVYQYSGSSQAKNNFNSFVYDLNTEFYKIVVQVEAPPEPPQPQGPELGDVHIKVLDHKGQLAPDATVTVWYLDKKEVYTSDAEGFIHIAGVPVGTKFKVEAKK